MTKTSRDMRKLRANPARFAQKLASIKWEYITENIDRDVDESFGHRKLPKS